MKIESKIDRPKVCRIAKLKGFDNILAGRDFADIFKEGHVYEVFDLMGVIMFKDLGEHETPTHEGSKFSQIMLEGKHLITKRTP